MSLPYIIDGETDADSTVVNAWIDAINTQVAIDAGTRLDAVESKSSSIISVLDYYDDVSVAGDGSHNDSTEWQLAFDAAIAGQFQLEIPPPQSGGYWRLEDTINVIPVSGQTQTRIRVRGRMNYDGIKWYGDSDTSVFYCLGLKNSVFEGLAVNISNSQSNVVVWDMDHTASISSQSYLHWKHCNVYTRSGYANTGWLLRSSGGASDHSFMRWSECVVAGDYAQGRGAIGWHIIGSNALVFLWENCTGYNLHSNYSGLARQVQLSGAINDSVTTIPLNTSQSALFPPNGGTVKVGSEQIIYTANSSNQLTGCTRGANSTAAASHSSNDVVSLSQSSVNEFGSAGMVCGTWVSCGGGYNERDFQFSVGNHTIIGGRWEVGHDHMYTGESATIPSHIVVIGEVVATYTPTTQLIRSGAPGHWTIDGCFFRDADYSSNKFFYGGGSTTTFPGVLSMRGTTIEGTSDSFWSLTDNWRTDVQGCSRSGTDDITTAILQTPLTVTVAADYTARNQDKLILVNDTSATRTITLPAAATHKGHTVTVKKQSASNTTVVDGNSSETIDGATTKTITSQYGFLTITCDGSGWQIVSQGGTIT